MRTEAQLAEMRIRIAAIEQDKVRAQGDFIELKADVKYIKEKIAKLP